MFVLVSSTSDRPLEVKSHHAYSPSALAATTASTTANTVAAAESDALQVAMMSAAMNSTPEHSALTFSEFFDFPQPAGALFADHGRDEEVRSSQYLNRPIAQIWD